MKKTVRAIIIAMLSLLVLASFASCGSDPEPTATPEEVTPAPEEVTPTPTPAPTPKATVKFVANMMGSASAKNTTDGNIPTSAAMSSNSYIDANGAIHGTFYLVDDSKFTAWQAGRTGKSYYARYDLDIDALTAGAEGSTGTYLFYVKTSSNGGTEVKEFGTSKSRAKCTLVGSTAEDAAKLKIEYYVIEGTYNKINNTTFTGELPEAQKNLISGKTPAVTVTIASDAVFKTE